MSAEGSPKGHEGHAGHPEHHPEHATHATASEKTKKAMNKAHIYMVAIAVIFLAIGFYAGGAMKGGATADAGSQAVGAKVVDFLQSRLSEGYPGISVELAGAKAFENMSGVYEVDTKITFQNQTQTITYYATQDGKLLITGIADLNEQLPVTGNEQPAPTEIPKSDKPVVELFVMSFCPYGVQAEQAMAPVIQLLGSKADIKVRFIESVGDTLDSVQSLHGTVEGIEDARQLCIAKNYDLNTYWKYLNVFDNTCPSVRTDATAFDACWKSAAQNASIDTTKIDNCMNSDGVTLLKAEETAANSYGVTGSPTLIINGVQYSGSRTPDAFKTAICDAFNTAPTECSQTLSASSGTANGNCG